MLCETCQKSEAMVFITSTAAGEKSKHQFCKSCADDYYASTPRMNSSRDLICLSKWFRSKLYDLLEQEHPEAFDNSSTEACIHGTKLMNSFLKEQLTANGIQLNDDGFEMLCLNFFGHRDFYERSDVYSENTKK